MAARSGDSESAELGIKAFSALRGLAKAVQQPQPTFRKQNPNRDSNTPDNLFTVCFSGEVTITGHLVYLKLVAPGNPVASASCARVNTSPTIARP